MIALILWTLNYDTNELKFMKDSQRTDLRLPKGKEGGEGRVECELGLADTKDYKQTR